jgi:hypothetical protein
MAPRVRVADAIECIRAADAGPLEALERGLRDSVVCKTVDWGGRPIAMFGVTPGPPNPDFRFGYVWLIGTPDLVRPPLVRTFLRVSEHWIKEISEGFDIVGNYVDADNAVHIRWLKRMGFTFQGETPYGPFNSPFLMFWRTV